MLLLGVAELPSVTLTVAIRLALRIPVSGRKGYPSLTDPGSLPNTITIRVETQSAYGVGRMTFDEASKLIKKGDIISLRKELQNGLTPNLCNQYSWTLLMDAALQGNTSIGSLLIENGAELDGRNMHRDTALSLAAHTGHASFVDLLLRKGASLECHPHGNSFDVWLDWACKYGRCSKKIRALFDKERQIRAERDRLLEKLT